MGADSVVTRPASLRRVAGFTLLEALIALAVTGLAVTVILDVGMRGVGTGFRLGSRAIDRANQQVSLQAIRDTLDDLVVPPIAISSAAAEAETEEAEAEGQGDTFEGEATTLSAYVIAARDTPCLPVGGQGRLTLTITVEGGRTQVSCQLNDEDAVALANLSWPDASFSYSEDGITWTDNWVVTRGENVEQAVVPDAELRQVYVRLSSSDGANELIGLVSSGRALPQTAAAVG
jgi:type II secretory pathway pseudopilin PulG